MRHSRILEIVFCGVIVLWLAGCVFGGTGVIQPSRGCGCEPNIGDPIVY